MLYFVVMAAHYPYFTEISIESDISDYENDPDSFLKDASTMYFEGKVENKDEGAEGRIKEDGIIWCCWGRGGCSQQMMKNMKKLGDRKKWLRVSVAISNWIPFHSSPALDTCWVRATRFISLCLCL